MLDYESIRILPLIIFPVLFVIGFFHRPVYIPISFLTLLLTKTANYYPVLISLRVESIVVVLGLIGVIVINKDFYKLSGSYDKVNKYFWIFIGTIAVSFMVSWDYKFSWDVKLYDFIKVLALYIMLLLAIKDTDDIKIFVWSFVILFTYLAYEPVYGFLSGTGGAREMYGNIYVAEFGILAGHVALSNNMNQMLPIALFLIPSIQNRLLKIAASIPVFMFIAAIIGSRSRGGAAGLVMLGIMLVYFSKNRVKNAIVVGTLVVALFAYSGTLTSTFERIDKSEAESRFGGLTNGIEMVLKGNLLGVGPGCYLLARQKYFNFYMESHNIYGQLIGDLGIPGTIAWFFLIRQIFRNLLKSRRELSAISRENDFLFNLTTGLMISLIQRLFVSLGSHGLYYFYWYVMAVLSVAILKCVENLSSNLGHDDVLSECDQGR